jgi:Co/Zn/Cd efflux system component
LLDAEMDEPVVKEIHEVVEACPVEAVITDLHVWRVGKGKYACILSLLAKGATEPDYVRRLLSIHEELVHITVEVNVLDDMSGRVAQV